MVSELRVKFEATRHSTESIVQQARLSVSVLNCVEVCQDSALRSQEFGAKMMKRFVRSWHVTSNYNTTVLHSKKISSILI